MPFKNCRQERAMRVHAPEVAARWADEYGSKCKGVPMGAKKRAIRHRAEKRNHGGQNAH